MMLVCTGSNSVLEWTPAVYHCRLNNANEQEVREILGLQNWPVSTEADRGHTDLNWSSDILH